MKKILLFLSSILFLFNYVHSDSPDTTKLFAAPTEQSLASNIPQPTTDEPKKNDMDSKINPKEVTQEEENIYLNFENSSLANVVNYMAELKKINLIPHKDLENAKVSLSIAEPLSTTTAWKIFLTLLESAGYTIILPEHSDVYRIVAKDAKLKEPLPVYINVPYETLPDSDITIRYVTMLTNITTDMVKDLLGTMLTNAPVEQPIINGFIITDKAYNIKSAMRVIQELDQTGLKEEVSIIKLQRANARDVKDTLSELMNTKDKDLNVFARMLGKHADNSMTYFSQVKIIAEERGNRLILLGTKNGIERIINFVTTYLDTEIKEVESPLHIYELQYADATQIAELLNQVVKIDSDSPAAKVGGIRAGVKYFSPMSIKPDKDGNRLLIITTDKQDWKLLKKTIDDLDKAQPQIAIETLIVSVDVTNNKNLGGAIRNKKNGTIGKDINFQANPAGGVLTSPNTPTTILGNMINAIGSGAVGTTALTLGKETNIWGVFQALKSQNNTNVISCPFITVSNRVAGTISVGSVKLVDSNKSISGTTITTGKEQQEAATKLTYTPQINLNGLINMKIAAQIKEFTGDNGNFTDKLLNTNVTVANGQVLVLGGFIKTNVSEDTGETPLLSKIPILGWFFKSKKRSINKSYIFFFISPTLMKPRKLPGMELYTKMKLHEAADGVEEAIETKNGKDPIANWFFNAEKETYSHKIIDYANARYQPTTVDIEDDPYYRGKPKRLPRSQEEQETPKEYKRPAEIRLVAPAPESPSKNDKKNKEKQKENSLKPEEAKVISITESKPVAVVTNNVEKTVEIIPQQPQQTISSPPTVAPVIPQIQPPATPLTATPLTLTPQKPVIEELIKPQETTIMQQRNRLKDILARNTNIKDPYLNERAA